MTKQLKLVLHYLKVSDNKLILVVIMGGGTKTPPKTKPAKPPDKVTEEDTDVMEVTETPATETGSNKSAQNGEGNIEETPANTGN